MIELTRPVLVHLAAVLVSQHDSLRVLSSHTFFAVEPLQLYTVEK